MTGRSRQHLASGSTKHLKVRSNSTLGDNGADELDLKIWDKEMDKYMAQRSWLKQNLKTSYIMIRG